VSLESAGDILIINPAVVTSITFHQACSYLPSRVVLTITNNGEIDGLRKLRYSDGEGNFNHKTYVDRKTVCNICSVRVRNWMEMMSCEK